MSGFIYNWEIAGHQKVLKEIEKDLLSGNVSHAYLFAGPPHVGKMTLARKLAKILQCEEQGNDADGFLLRGCGKCQICSNIAKGYHPDTIELLDDSENLKIDPMREILARLSTTANGNYKILLVQNIERMTPETANILLKTLEEPPSQVIFLFTTSNLEDVLLTVLSRVRLLKLSSLSPADLMGFLQKKFPAVDQEKIQEIMDLSFGMPGRAVHFCEDEEYFEEVKGLLEKVLKVLQHGDIVEKFTLINEATQAPKTDSDKKFEHEFFDVFLLALRYTMLEELRNYESEMKHGAERREVEMKSSRQKLLRTLDALRRSQDAVRLQKRNVNARLLFENIILNT